MNIPEELIFKEFWASSDFYQIDFDEVRVRLSDREKQSLKSVQHIFNDLSNIHEVAIDISDYEFYIDGEKMDDQYIKGTIDTAVLIACRGDIICPYVRLCIEDGSYVILEGVA